MAAEDELLLPQLPELFKTSKELLDDAEVATEPAGSRTVQEKVFKGLDLLEKAAEILLQLDLFNLEAIASTDLKYLLVPVFQGALTMKQVKPSKRLDHLQWAQEHYKLLSCATDVMWQSLSCPKLRTQLKITLHKQKEELEHRLSAMKSAVESAVCEYYLLRLQRWIDSTLTQEIKILRERDSSREASTSNSSCQERPPVKPFILTRNMAQAKVFGVGYPSLATMTVSDWYEQGRKYGALPDQGIAKATPEEFRKAAQQQEDQEEKEEEDDEPILYRAQEWDDWKGTHPRGYGSRQNMG
uniref:Immunoglobulin-binding protein 1 n=1 Tax=Mandrillus leucophaeus TaxID=9568 RepID=A0A2K5XP95_MANLE